MRSSSWSKAGLVNRDFLYLQRKILSQETIFYLLKGCDKCWRVRALRLTFNLVGTWHSSSALYPLRQCGRIKSKNRSRYRYRPRSHPRSFRWTGTKSFTAGEEGNPSRQLRTAYSRRSWQNGRVSRSPQLWSSRARLHRADGSSSRWYGPHSVCMQTCRNSLCHGDWWLCVDCWVNCSTSWHHNYTPIGCQTHQRFTKNSRVGPNTWLRWQQGARCTHDKSRTQWPRFDDHDEVTVEAATYRSCIWHSIWIPLIEHV